MEVMMDATLDIAIDKIQTAFEGEANRLGLRDINDVVRLVKELRASR